MKVKVITRHGPSNYGSLLQALATTKAVESLGHECQIIDYRRSDECGLNAIRAALDAKENWKNNPVKRALYIGLRWPEEGFAEHRFDSFRERYLNMTPRVDSLEDIATMKADVWMTGSDQVWGPTGVDPYDRAYFLQFPAEGRRVAYAASFGRTKFSPAVTDEYRRMLSGYDRISVREDSAADIIEKMDLPRPEQVLDPTFLLTEKQWETYIDPEPIGKRYILVYQIHNNPALDAYAGMLQKRLGLPLLRVTPFLHQINRSGRIQLLPSPGRFLRLIKDASLMVTDSFHGTAFALNFNTDFVEILPNNGTGTRNHSILRFTGLTDRVITDHADFETPTRKIDFAPVNRIINDARIRSYNVLKHLLS